MKLFYRDLGEGEPLIILHGLFGSSDNWMTLAKRFAEHYQVFALDLRNHGSSPHSDTFDYDTMAKDVSSFISERDLSNVNIIGHSMGGKVAMQYALENPSMPKRMIVVDIAPKFYPVHHDTILKGLESISLNDLASRREADEVLAQFIPQIGVRHFLLKNLTRNNDKEFIWKINLPIISKEIEAVGEAMDSALKYEGDTLFIDGDQSGYIKSSDAPLIKLMFPNSTIETIAGAGHWVHAEKPNEFYKLAMDFLKA